MEHGLARHTDPETSHAAAAVVNVNALERVIIDRLSTSGALTCSEIAYRASAPRDSISPRMKSLVTKGLVTNTGEKRTPLIPEDGRRRPLQIIWALTKAGWDFASAQHSEPV